jgi:hypothetical protein
MPKTLRDCILETGIKDKKFQTQNKTDYFIYKVLDIKEDVAYNISLIIEVLESKDKELNETLKNSKTDYPICDLLDSKEIK